MESKEIGDISGLSHGVGWCAPQQGTCKLTLNVKEGDVYKRQGYNHPFCRSSDRLQPCFCGSGQKTSGPLFPWWTWPVSYTHLDVYKRQSLHHPRGVLAGTFGEAPTVTTFTEVGICGDILRLTCLLYTSRCV